MGKALTIKIGDVFITRCGTQVTVVDYINCKAVTVEDDVGNKRTVTANTLRGGLSWTKKVGGVHKGRKPSPSSLVKRSGRALVGPKPKKCPFSLLGHYVYMVTVLGEIVYIGSGKDDRILHAYSGKSGNRELNRLYFEKAPAVVEVIRLGMTTKEARDLERQLIAVHKPRCNVKIYRLLQ